MGWASGVSVFDAALDAFLDYVPEEDKYKAVYEFYQGMGDWDTEIESRYWNYLAPGFWEDHEYLVDDEIAWGAGQFPWDVLQISEERWENYKETGSFFYE